MAFLKYTLLRLLILGAVIALLFLLGLRTWYVLLPVAVLVSGVLSIFVLNRTRDDVSASLSGRLIAIKSRVDETTRAEDEWDEAQRHH